MATVNFSELFDAFEFANFNGPGECRAFVSLDMGSLHCVSDDIQLEEELPEGFESSDRYLALPHKNDLNFGRDLALSFTAQYLANDYEMVAGYFRRRGAYGRFKDLLERRDVLDDW